MVFNLALHYTPVHFGGVLIFLGCIIQLMLIEANKLPDLPAPIILPATPGPMGPNQQYYVYFPSVFGGEDSATSLFGCGETVITNRALADSRCDTPEGFQQIGYDGCTWRVDGRADHPLQTAAGIRYPVGETMRKIAQILGIGVSSDAADCRVSTVSRDTVEIAMQSIGRVYLPFSQGGVPIELAPNVCTPESMIPTGRYKDMAFWGSSENLANLAARYPIVNRWLAIAKSTNNYELPAQQLAEFKKAGVPTLLVDQQYLNPIYDVAPNLEWEDGTLQWQVQKPNLTPEEIGQMITDGTFVIRGNRDWRVAHVGLRADTAEADFLPMTDPRFKAEISKHPYYKLMQDYYRALGQMGMHNLSLKIGKPEVDNSREKDFTIAKADGTSMQLKRFVPRFQASTIKRKPDGRIDYEKTRRLAVEEESRLLAISFLAYDNVVKAGSNLHVNFSFQATVPPYFTGYGWPAPWSSIWLNSEGVQTILKNINLAGIPKAADVHLGNSSYSAHTTRRDVGEWKSRFSSTMHYWTAVTTKRFNGERTIPNNAGVVEFGFAVDSSKVLEPSELSANLWKALAVFQYADTQTNACYYPFDSGSRLEDYNIPLSNPDPAKRGFNPYIHQAVVVQDLYRKIFRHMSVNSGGLEPKDNGIVVSATSNIPQMAYHKAETFFRDDIGASASPFIYNILANEGVVAILDMHGKIQTVVTPTDQNRIFEVKDGGPYTAIYYNQGETVVNFENNCIASGRVVNRENPGYGGGLSANVLLVHESQQVFDIKTDDNGFFILKSIPPGKYRIYVGQNTWEITIDPKKSMGGWELVVK